MHTKESQDTDEPKEDNDETIFPIQIEVILHETKEKDSLIRAHAIEHFVPSFETVQLLPAEGHHITNVTIQGCKFSKSKCLKLYCNCFQAR